ncbi:unnamed protein product [Trichobilharzia regenti]|nr:unnamed protein product [Trichobilharzia regenti]
MGAETVRTPASANFDDPDSPFLVSEKIKREIGSSAHIIDQYTNPYNPIAHFDETAEEIFRDCTNENGKVWLDMLVVGAGTGGTISGLSRKMKMKLPNSVFSLFWTHQYYAFMTFTEDRTWIFRLQGESHFSS